MSQGAIYTFRGLASLYGMHGLLVHRSSTWRQLQVEGARRSCSGQRDWGGGPCYYFVLVYFAVAAALIPAVLLGVPVTTARAVQSRGAPPGPGRAARPLAPPGPSGRGQPLEITWHGPDGSAGHRH